MGAESLIETTFKAYLQGLSTVTSLCGAGANGIKIENDFATIVAYPTVFINVEPAYDTEGFESPSYTDYKETRVSITSETFADEDKSGSAVGSLYDAVYSAFNKTTILALLDSASSAKLHFYECKVMPNEGFFEDDKNTMIRQRTLVLRVKIRIL